MLWGYKLFILTNKKFIISGDIHLFNLFTFHSSCSFIIIQLKFTCQDGKHIEAFYPFDQFSLCSCLILVNPLCVDV